MSKGIPDLCGDTRSLHHWPYFVPVGSSSKMSGCPLAFLLSSWSLPVILDSFQQTYVCSHLHIMAVHADNALLLVVPVSFILPEPTFLNFV